MTHTLRPLEDVNGLALLRRADVAVDLHRRLARRVAEQLLRDPRMDAGVARTPISRAARSGLRRTVAKGSSH